MRSTRNLSAGLPFLLVATVSVMSAGSLAPSERDTRIAAPVLLCCSSSLGNDIWVAAVAAGSAHPGLVQHSSVDRCAATAAALPNPPGVHREYGSHQLARLSPPLTQPNPTQHTQPTTNQPTNQPTTTNQPTDQPTDRPTNKSWPHSDKPVPPGTERRSIFANWVDLHVERSMTSMANMYVNHILD